ncbi:MAG: hypothetical protein ACRC2R_02740 [Xenococcaceae cyanobacterium]
MPDFSNFKVPVFTGINDAPKEPTITEPGNGSDVIARFNALCDFLSTNLANVVTLENLATVATSGNYQDLQNIPNRVQLNINGTTYQNINTVVIVGSNFYVNEENGTITINFDANSGGGAET